MEGFQRFGSGEARNFTVNVSEGTPNTVCGGRTYLNLLVDMTARNNAQGQFSEVAIQRGAGTPGPSEYKSRIQCGVEQSTCD